MRMYKSSRTSQRYKINLNNKLLWISHEKSSTSQKVNAKSPTKRDKLKQIVSHKKMQYMVLVRRCRKGDYYAAGDLYEFCISPQ